MKHNRLKERVSSSLKNVFSPSKFSPSKKEFDELLLCAVRPKEGSGKIRRRKIGRISAKKSLSPPLFLLFLSLLGAVSSCSASELPDWQREIITITTEKKRVEVEVVIADIPEKHAQGLMGVQKMKKNEGALFLFSRPQRLSFWMKNTPIPLSIAYVTSDGTIAQIEDLHPFNTTSVPSLKAVQYALEVNQGFFEERGIKVGDKITPLPSTLSRP